MRSRVILLLVINRMSSTNYFGLVDDTILYIYKINTSVYDVRWFEDCTM